MLFDGEILLSYRVVELADLSAGEGLTLNEMWFGVTGDSLRHVISAIAWEDDVAG
jgi:hypothetical protein